MRLGNLTWLKTMRAIRWLLWIILVLIGVIFTSLNGTMVTIHYYIGSISLFLPLLLLIALTIGLLLGSLFLLPTVWRLRRRAAQLNRQIKQSAGTTPHQPIQS